jgi:hypothetical protein
MTEDSFLAPVGTPESRVWLDLSHVASFELGVLTGAKPVFGHDPMTDAPVVPVVPPPGDPPRERHDCASGGRRAAGTIGPTL